MRQFYYLKGTNLRGPYTVERLKEKNLHTDTLIWSDGMSNWDKLKDVPEFAGYSHDSSLKVITRTRRLKEILSRLFKNKKP